MNIPRMKKVYSLLRFCLVVSAFSSLSFSSAQAQIATEGQEFWFAFLPHAGATNLRIMVTSNDSTANVTVSMPANGGFTDINQAVTTDKSAIIDVPVGNIASAGTGDFGFKLRSDKNVSVYLLNSKTGSLDGTVVYPHDSSQDWTRSITGNFSDYFVTTPEANSSFAVVATVDATDVILTPSGGAATTVTLNAGQTHVITGADLSGYRVQACKPVLTFAGGETLTQGCTATNHMMSQMYPFETWGTRFFTVPSGGAITNYGVKIVASTDGTTVTIDSLDNNPITLNKGQAVTIDTLTRPACFEASAPVTITQFMKGNNCNGNGGAATGDGNPAMVVLNHVQQSVDQVTFSVDTTNTSSVANRYLTIIIPDGNQNALQLNGQAIPAGSFTQYAVCTDYVHATVDISTIIPSGVFSKATLSGGNGLLAYVHGRSANDGLVYSAGYNVSKIPVSASGNPNPTCTGTSTTFNASGPNNIASYLWTFPDGSTATGTSASYTIRSTADTSFSVKATNDAGCDSTISFTITVDTIILALPEEAIVCDTLTLDAGAGFSSYTWSNGANTQTTQVTEAGTYSVTVTRNSCRATASVRVVSGTLPTSKIAVSPAPPTANVLGLERTAYLCVEEGETLSLTADSTNTAESVTWNTGLNTNQITVNAAGTYIATIRFSAGCVVVDSVVVQDVCEVKFLVPTAFSPNGDGTNDGLQIFGKGFFNLDFRVFNRWGELIYFSKSQENQWDGTAHGFDAPNGTYVWRAIYEDVKSPGTKIKKFGRVTLVR
ncbi:T9SS C-terminal target domain-containing protein [Microscilla marina]|nr:T9SS C-terminal target domain-containing protein [Microscilla marina]